MHLRRRAPCSCTHPDASTRPTFTPTVVGIDHSFPSVWFICAAPPDIPAEALLSAFTFVYSVLFATFLLNFKVASNTSTKDVVAQSINAATDRFVQVLIPPSKALAMSQQKSLTGCSSDVLDADAAERNEEQDSDDDEDAIKDENEGSDSDDGEDAFNPIRSALGFFDGD